MKRGLKLGVFVTICLFGSLVGKKVKNLFTHPVFFTLSPHSSLALVSSEAHFHLRSFLSQQQTAFSDSSACAQVLVKQFSFLKKAKIEFQKGKFSAYVQAARPVLMLNEQFVLTDHDHLVVRSMWNPDCLRDIPSLTVTDISALSQSGKVSLKRLGYALRDSYQVEWMSDLLVKFRDPQFPRVTVLGDAGTQPEQLLNSCCAQLKSEIMKKKISRKGPNDWCIDVRFKNQMIVFPGGRT